MPRVGSTGLTARRARILAAIVEEYVRTAEPVGSRTVRERQAFEVSTATIRNEMSALEEQGYIAQPHTSAGRVPVDRGYRAYVDEIMPPCRPSIEEMAWVRAEFRRSPRDADSLHRTASRVLSRLTTAPAMVMAPEAEGPILTELKLTSISSTVVLLTYGTRPGGRLERLLELPEPLTAGQVQALGAALARRCCGSSTDGLSLCAPDTLAAETAPYPVPEDLLSQIRAAVESDSPHRVYVDGAALALDYPECRELSHLRPIMQALDEDCVVCRLLKPAARRGTLTITIGHEQEVVALRHCSSVARPYRGPGGDVFGALGVIGPTRLDYHHVVAAVSTVAEEISGLLASALAER